jgi:hypothetical protein
MLASLFFLLLELLDLSDDVGDNDDADDDATCGICLSFSSVLLLSLFLLVVGQPFSASIGGAKFVARIGGGGGAFDAKSAVGSEEEGLFAVSDDSSEAAAISRLGTAVSASASPSFDDAKKFWLLLVTT